MKLAAVLKNWRFAWGDGGIEKLFGKSPFEEHLSLPVASLKLKEVNACVIFDSNKEIFQNDFLAICWT